MPRRLIALALAAATVVGGATAAPSAYASGPASVQLQGRGYGHGHGMSQYGAQGRAKAGKSTRQIMSFYYPGTSWGTATGSISVLITEDTNADVVVADRSGLTFQALQSKRTWKLSRSGARRWRIVPADGGAGSRLQVHTRSSSWQTVRTVAGTAQFGAGGAPMKLYYPGGSRTYRGVLRSAGDSTRETVNVVSLETYLRGVVPQEMPALWKPAAVRSQAVAARTYAAYERANNTNPDYQICDTSHCQVYAGASAEYSASDTAIKATAHQVLTYDGKPAYTQFSASDGGWTTASADYPYLQARQDTYDDYPTWSVTLKAAAIEAAVQSWYGLDIGTFQRLDQITHDGNGSWGGRVVSIRIVGSTATKTVSGDSFRSMMGLKSTLFHQV